MTKQHPLATKIWLVFILGTISATGPLSIDLYLPGLPQMTNDLHTSTSLIQLSLTACLIGLALGQLIAGPLSDKFGRKRPLIIGFLLFGIVSLLIAGSSSIYSLIALRFIQGLAGATGQVLSRAIARDLFSGSALTKFYSMLSSVNGIFPVISPVIGGFIIKFVDWKGIFILLAIIGFLVVIALWLGVKETLPPEKRIQTNISSMFTMMGGVLKNGRFVEMILATGLISGGLFSYISASSFVFQTFFKMSVQGFSLLYALNGIGLAIGSVIPGFTTGIIPVKTQTKVTFATTFATGLLLVISSFLFHNLLLVIILVFLILVQSGSLFTLTTSVIMNTSAKNTGAISALLGVSQNAIGGIMSPLVGLLGTQTYLPMAACIAGCFGIGYILFTNAIKSTRLI